MARPFLPPQWGSMINDWQNSFKALETNYQTLAGAAGSITLAPLQGVFKRLAEQGEKVKLVADTGWLPHYTTPFEFIDLDQNTEEIRQTITNYYKNSWEAVEDKFIENLTKHDIDNEAKQTFREALASHRQGLYRVAPRLLFPEIERVASNEFYEGKRKVKSDSGKWARITSLPEFRHSVGELPAGEIFTYEFGMTLFEKLEAHLYEYVGETKTEVAKFAADPVPNRHAAIHGIISYTTAQNSMNVIIMTDFMFHIISCMKRYLVNEEIA